MKKIFLAAVLVVNSMIAMLPLTAHADVDVGIAVGPAPPPVPYAVAPPSRYGYVWVPGYWDWSGRAYIWQQGYWLPERADYVYEAPYWYYGSDGWYRRSGNWHHRSQHKPYPKQYDQPHRSGDNHSSDHGKPSGKGQSASHPDRGRGSSGNSDQRGTWSVDERHR